MDINGVPYIKNHIPTNTKKRRPQIKLNWDYLTIHSTGNPRSTAQNERGWLVNPDNTSENTGWHICVDDKGAVEAIPLDEIAWHAGDGGTGKGNRTSIGLEICESGNRAKTLLNAAKVAAFLLQSKGKDVTWLAQHFTWNGKNCPSILRANDGKGWREFVESVRSFLVNEEPNPLKQALQVLVKAGIVSSTDYWLQNAVVGKTVKGESVASLILKTAEKLRR